MKYKFRTLKAITEKQASAIVEAYSQNQDYGVENNSPEGIFIVPQNNGFYTVIDNSDRMAFCDDFENVHDAFTWIYED